MKIKLLIISILIFIPISGIHSQIENSKKFYTGVFFEYNTLFLLTHNIKLHTDLNYYGNDKLILSVQPGAEIIYSIPGAEWTFYPGSPFYEINLLQSVQLFPNYGISIKPFIGLSYRIKTQENDNDYAAFNLKYGSTLQLNISEKFKIIGKIMNLPKKDSDGDAFLLGVGVSFYIF